MSKFKMKYKTFVTFMTMAHLYHQTWFTYTIHPDGMVTIQLHTPSGCNNTAHDNTLILMLVFNWIWLDNKGPPDFDCFMMNFIGFFFGDDSIISVSPYGWQFIGPKQILKSFEKLGWEMEFSSQWEFLGHYIVYNDTYHMYVPIYPENKALYVLATSDAKDLSHQINKAFGVRQLVSTNDRIFPLVNDYCEWLLEKMPKSYQQLTHMNNMFLTPNVMNVGQLAMFGQSNIIKQSINNSINHVIIGDLFQKKIKKFLNIKKIIKNLGAIIVVQTRENLILKIFL